MFSLYLQDFPSPLMSPPDYIPPPPVTITAATPDAELPPPSPITAANHTPGEIRVGVCVPVCLT